MNDDVRKFLGFLDDGPQITTIKQIKTEIQRKKIKIGDFFDIFLENKKKGIELRDLIQQFDELNENSQKKIKKMGEMKWIHHTQKIELESLTTVKKTQIVIDQQIKGAQIKPTKKEKQTIHLFNLLQETKREKESIKNYSIDSVWIQKCHKKMFKSENSFKIGKYRTIGTQPLDKNYKYPHHTTIKESVNVLCEVVHQMVRYIEKNTSKICPKFICYVIGLASFAQFHFVSLHPFEDGNGRMCRFISKYILDSFMPVPIPMFSDRDEYFGKLRKGRKCPNILRKSSFLCDFMFNSAINFYKECISNTINNPHFLMIVQDCEELSRRIKNIGEKVSSKMIKKFIALDEDSHFFTIIGGRKFKILKRTVIDFETL